MHAALQSLGEVGSVSAEVLDGEGAAGLGRVCALRKTEEGVRLALAKVRRQVARNGRTVQPATPSLARLFILFTTAPERDWSAAKGQECGRTRWQAELGFTRFKALIQLGCLPRYNDESAKTRACGKLVAAPLVEKLLHHARAVSACGCEPGPETSTQRLK
ncbi:MAG: hypothetical protein OXN97_20915 [Bryobacterales bacterium]|nr:hypothetical protein [Bryobacterales bacterium]